MPPVMCLHEYRQAVLCCRVIVSPCVQGRRYYVTCHVSPCVQAGGIMLPCYCVAVCTGRRYYVTCHVSPCVQAVAVKNYKTPVVCMVVEGGVNTVHTVLDYVTDEPPVPVVVMNDSGRAANLLSLAHKIIGTERFSRHESDCWLAGCMETLKREEICDMIGIHCRVWWQYALFDSTNFNAVAVRCVCSMEDNGASLLMSIRDIFRCSLPVAEKVFLELVLLMKKKRLVGDLYCLCRANVAISCWLASP
jgi:hypothetical protein